MNAPFDTSSPLWQSLITTEIVDSPLASSQNQAARLLKEKGLPTRPQTPYVPLKHLLSTHFPISTSSSTAISKEQIGKWLLKNDHKHIVFVNGYYQPHLSSSFTDDVEVWDLFDSHPFELFVSTHLKQRLAIEPSSIHLSSLLSARSGVLVLIPKDQLIDTPIEILHIVSGEQANRICPQIILSVGMGSKAEFYYRTIEEPSIKGPIQHLLLPNIDMVLEEESDLTFGHCHREVTHSLSWEHIRLRLKKKAFARWTSLSEKAPLQRQEIHALLTGLESHVEFYALGKLQERAQLHQKVSIEHLAPATHSLQLFKNALSEYSRSSFCGKIFVDPIAQKTNAYQLNQNLLLDLGAIAHSRPELKIFADDVKASHGCTVGQLDSKQLFYLQSRGIPLNQAKALLLEGFYQDIVKHF